MAPQNTQTVTVLGAGVVGLTCALELIRSNPHYRITVIGLYLPGDLNIDYTSPFAGADWHSFGPETAEFDTVGYHAFRNLALTEPRSGVWPLVSHNYYTSEALRAADGDTSRLIPWFSKLTNMEVVGGKLPPHTVFGARYDGVVISTSLYLNYLVQLLLEKGVVIRRVRKINSVDEARNLHSSGQKAALVVNASGLGAGSLEGYTDSKRNYAVRGQTVLIRNSAPCEFSVHGFEGYENETLYIMPRKEGGSIVGGCFHESRDPKEDPEFTKRTLTRALRYVPELVDPKVNDNPPEIEIVSVNVGLRPFREGGPRVERDPGHDWLVHAYGAGGGGYQGSYGFAARVVKLAEEVFEGTEGVKGKL